MELETFFFDTYAFFEIIEGNQNYQRFTTGVAIITTKLNLMELYYGLLLKYDEKTAEKYYNRLTRFVVNVDDEIIKEAMKFRLLYKKRNLSYADCIGYILARKHGVKFLTGDKEFENIEYVKFVK